MKLHRTAVRRDAFLLLVGGMVSRLCGFIFVVVLARTLSPEQIGMFSLAETLADTLILIASFNLDSVIVRRIAAGPPAEATVRFAPLMGFRLVSGPIYLLTMVVLSRSLHLTTPWLVPTMGVYTLMESLYFSLSDMFVGVNRPAMRAGIEATAELTFTVCFVIAMLLHPSLATLLAVTVLRGVVLLGAVLYLVRSQLGPFHVGWDNRLIREGAPFLLMTFLDILQGKSETMLLAAFSTFAAVGIFQLALRLFTALLFVPRAISGAVFPRFAASGFDAANRRRFLHGLGGLTLVSLAGSGVLLLGPELPARVLFGPATSQVLPVLRSMAPLLLLRFVLVFVATGLLALKRERAVLAALAVGTTVGLLADLLLIPSWGPVGASVGLSVSAICQCLMLGATLLSMLREPLDDTAGTAPYAAAT